MHVMKNELQHFVVQSKDAPIIEVDSEVNAVYIYFNRHKLARTVEIPSKTMTLTVDLDAHGDVVGIEAIGAIEIEVKNCSIWFMSRLPR